MNTLIKIIITSVLGFFGPLTEIEDIQTTYKVDSCQESEFISFDIKETGFCLFNENSCKMLNNKFDS